MIRGSTSKSKSCYESWSLWQQKNFSVKEIAVSFPDPTVIVSISRIEQVLAIFVYLFRIGLFVKVSKLRNCSCICLHNPLFRNCSVSLPYIMILMVL